MATNTRSKSNKNSQKSQHAPSIVKKKNLKKENLDIPNILRQHKNQLNALEKSVNQNIALVWNLVVECETNEYFGLIHAQFNAVLKFLDEVIGAESYSRSAVNYCNWFDTRKNIMEVNMSSMTIDKVRQKQATVEKMKGKNGLSLQFARKKTTVQRESDEIASEVRIALLKMVLGVL